MRILMLNGKDFRGILVVNGAGSPFSVESGK